MGQVSQVDKSKAAPRVKKGVLRGWIAGLREEFSKISWTTREELKTYTKIVAIATLVVGLGIYFMDLVVQSGLRMLGLLVRIVVGG